MDIRFINYIERAANYVENLNATKKFHIDGPSLWNELKEQVKLESEISELKVAGNDFLEMSKRMLARYENKIRYSIRQNPSQFKIDKVTDKAIAEAVAVYKPYQDMEDEHHKLESVVNSVIGVFNQLQTRKSMIRDMVTLYIHSYWRGDNLDGERDAVSKCIMQNISSRSLAVRQDH